MALTKLFQLRKMSYMTVSTDVTCEMDSLNATTNLALKILLQVMPFRRLVATKTSCALASCDACLAPHLSQVISSIDVRQPITFVLPAFPGKSPNPAKVLGTLPDMAEQLSLEFLNQLCKQIQTIYSPGARVILCSDGRVFNDVIGIKDTDVTEYQRELSRMIHEHAFTSLSTFNLDDLYSTSNFHHMRHELMEQYGEPLDLIKTAVRKGSQSACSTENEEMHRQYCGMTRFLVEDASHPAQLASRNAIQKACRHKAYLVIQRSRAWSELIAERFPQAVRLSIHPQTCGSAKLGIRLMEAESWMTPWHGVAVETDNHFVLLKRAQAEALNACLRYREGRPSHYQLKDKQALSKLRGVIHGT